ncbi:MAG: MFS transporter [Pseudomonadota bacterium]
MTPAAHADSPAFKRINRAMLFAGFAAFALLYSVQPLMPQLAREFALTPTQSSWALSSATLALAVSLVLSSALSDRIGRKSLMALALAGSAGLTLLSAFARDFSELLVLRTLTGLALGGMPAVAMAYLSEEIEPRSLGLSMGIYIAGSAFGGMSGRLLASVIADHASWRWSLALLGAAGLVAAWEFWRSLPASRRFVSTQPGWRTLAVGVRGHLADAGLPWLFALAFLLMGVYVSMFNYISYRLQSAPFNLSQSAFGALSLLYLLGMYGAVWAGRLADRVGRRNVLWIVLSLMLGALLLTLSNALALIVLGMALFTFAFFATHSVASSWVGRRAAAPQALASALYLFFYYAGSSLVGSFSGMAFKAGGWPALVALLSFILGIGLLIALRLRSLAPLAATSGGTGERTTVPHAASRDGCVDLA